MKRSPFDPNIKRSPAATAAGLASRKGKMMLALSVRQPWAWAIIHAGKDIENRTWRPPRVQFGRIAIHAAKGIGRLGEYSAAFEFMSSLGVTCQDYEQIHHGGIIGTVELVDVVTASDSPWFEGPFGLVLRDPRPLPFQPCKGRLGFFEVEVTG